MCLSTHSLYQPSYSKHKPCKTRLSLQFRPHTTSAQLWTCQASRKAGHLTPWGFNIDFQLPTKPFHIVPGLWPPSPFCCIFYLSLRTPSQCPFPPAPHQHFYCTPLLTGTMLCTSGSFYLGSSVCSLSYQWSSSDWLRGKQESSCGKGEACAPCQNLLCF